MGCAEETRVGIRCQFVGGFESFPRARRQGTPTQTPATDFGEEVGELLEGRLGVLCLPPKVGGQEAVGQRKRVKRGLHEVAQSLAASGRAGVAVFNASHLQHLLGGAGSDDAGSTGGGDQANGDGAALACNETGRRGEQNEGPAKAKR